MDGDRRAEGPATSEPANLEYLRRVYANVLDWYKVADAKAQVILTLNGVIIAFSSSNLLVSHQYPLRSVGGRVLVGAAAAALASAIYFAIDAMHSNLREGALRESRRPGLVLGQASTYQPEEGWWFGTIATLSRTASEARASARRNTIAAYLLPRGLVSGRAGGSIDSYGEATEVFLRSIDADGERRALAAQIRILSAHVLDKHRAVNRGWVASGVALVFIMGATLAS